MSIEIQCPNCNEYFDVPSSLKGGLSNCPSCNRAVEVPGGQGGLFWLLLLGSLALCSLVSYAAYDANDPTFSLLLGGVGLVVIIIVFSCC